MQNTYQQELENGLSLMQAGLHEQAVLKLRSVADHAKARGDKLTATKCYLVLSDWLWRQNKTAEATTAAIDATTHAEGTDLEFVADAGLELLRAQYELDEALGANRGMPFELTKEDMLKQSLSAISEAEASVAKIPSGEEESRLSLESKALTLRINVYKAVIDLLADTTAGKSVKDLSAEWWVLLTAALRNVPPNTVLPEGSSPTRILLESVELLDWLDNQRPWDKALLKQALALNDRVIALDKNKSGKAGEISLAQDFSQRADLYARRGDLEQAIVRKTEALKYFKRSGSFDDIVAALGALRDLYIEQATQSVPRESSNVLTRSSSDHSETRGLADRGALENALKASEELFARVEQQKHAYIGESIEEFLVQWRDAYRKHLSLLMSLYAEQIVKGDPAAIERLALHFDRTNFRATRRDLAVYRELGDQLTLTPEIQRRLDQQREIVVKAERERERAVAENRQPEDFSPVPGIFVDSPYQKVTSSKQELINIVADVKRQHAGTAEPVEELPANLEEVKQGMGADSGIVVFTRVAPNAVVITNSNIRLVDLPGVSAEIVRKLSEQIRSGLAYSGGHHDVRLRASDSKESVTNAMGKLAELVWYPLGRVPRNVTVVLTRDLIGVPFESLPLANGMPIVMEHTIRYAFGLSPRLGEYRQETFQSGIVTGAENFAIRNLQPLDGARNEINEIRDLLTEHGMQIAPKETLLSNGKTLLSEGRVVDIAHIATHSILDESSPMVDALAFQKDEVFAYELALSPLRAKLFVLSACELFSFRGDRDNPVSGITTATLARMSPRVITTLWPIDDQASRLFMLRFYHALLETHEPSLALAETKRAFLSPPELASWSKSKGLSGAESAQVQTYSDPYFWAPFVLAVGLPQR